MGCEKSEGWLVTSGRSEGEKKSVVAYGMLQSVSVKSKTPVGEVEKSPGASATVERIGSYQLIEVDRVSAEAVLEIKPSSSTLSGEPPRSGQPSSELLKVVEKGLVSRVSGDNWAPTLFPNSRSPLPRSCMSSSDGVVSSWSADSWT